MALLANSFLALGFFSLRGALGDSPPLLPEDSSPSRSACACAIAASMSSSSDGAFLPRGFFGFGLPGALGDLSPLLLSLLLSPLLSRGAADVGRRREVLLDVQRDLHRVVGLLRGLDSSS